MLLLAILFSMGLIHGVGPDHLAAITAYGAAAGRDFRRLVFFAVRFAIGHAAVLAGAGLLAKFGSMYLPEKVEHGFEIGAGSLLVFTGLLLLGMLLAGKIKVHTHHHHHSGQIHHHFHLHMISLQKHEHAHGTLAVGLGALFAMGGARSLVTVLPIAFGHTFTESLFLVAAFSLGIIASMVAYAWVTQFALTRISRYANSDAHHRWIMLASAYGVALFCVITGAITIQGQLHLRLF
jgi:nickel/cobalt transporter (NicO) family protein